MPHAYSEISHTVRRNKIAELLNMAPVPFSPCMAFSTSTTAFFSHLSSLASCSSIWRACAGKSVFLSHSSPFIRLVLVSTAHRRLVEGLAEGHVGCVTHTPCEWRFAAGAAWSRGARAKPDTAGANAQSRATADLTRIFFAALPRVDSVTLAFGGPSGRLFGSLGRLESSPRWTQPELGCVVPHMEHVFHAPECQFRYGTFAFVLCMYFCTCISSSSSCLLSTTRKQRKQN